MKNTMLMVLALALAACKGDMGPMGPAGPMGPRGEQGVEGPAGKVQYFVGQTTLDYDGDGVIPLPIGAGDATHPPLIVCYIGDGTGAWLMVSLDVNSATCGGVWANGRWHASLINGVPGWYFRAVAAW